MYESLTDGGGAAGAGLGLGRGQQNMMNCSLVPASDRTPDTGQTSGELWNIYCLEQQTIHRFSQPRRRPLLGLLLGPSPG